MNNLRKSGAIFSIVALLLVVFLVPASEASSSQNVTNDVKTPSFSHQDKYMQNLSSALASIMQNLSLATNHNSTFYVQNELNMRFINWYLLNRHNLPTSYQILNKQTALAAFGMFVHNSTAAQYLQSRLAYLELQNASRILTYLNLSEIFSLREGVLLLSFSSSTSNGPSVISTYKYTDIQNGTPFSVIYTVTTENGKSNVYDPGIFENEFPIMAQILWWTEQVGTQYNINLVFSNYANALNFKNFLVSDLEVENLIDAVEMGLLFGLISFGVAESVAASFIVAAATDLINYLVGSASPTSIADNINQAFTNEESAWHYFNVVYTLNYYTDGTVSQFVVSSPDPSGGSIEFWSSVPFFSSSMDTQFVNFWTTFYNLYGSDNMIEYASPAYWPYYLSLTGLP